jgi:acyl-CoA thioesterase I
VNCCLMNKEKITITIIILCLASLALFFFSNKSNNDIYTSEIVPKTTPDSLVKIIAFGDSLTAGYGLNLSEAYPAQLESYLQKKGHEVTVINSGVSGETSRGNLERADFIASQKPDVVILGIGGNDAMRLLPLDEVRKNIEETLVILKKGSTPPPFIILLKMQAPLTAGLGYKREFDAMYEEIAAEKGLILVPFLTADLFLDSTNKLPDGIHYNQEGYRKAVEMYIAPALTEVLDKLR